MERISLVAKRVRNAAAFCKFQKFSTPTTMQVTMSDIRLGPEHLERRISARFGDQINSGKRSGAYRQLIEETETGYPYKHGRKFRVKSFYLGYLYHQLARLTEDVDKKRRFLECALTHYQNFIQRKGNDEEQFFACLSAGILLQALDQPWPEAEEIFLAAYELYPQRGEPIDQIIQHYLSIQQWPIAFLFSSSAKDQFYGKLPDQGNWGIDKSFYNWRVLHLHTAACFSLGRMQEATETFCFLHSLTLRHLEIFLREEIDLIWSQKNLFPEFEIYATNSA
ncbi:hypothetical protein [Puia dinghuensis]|uniref:hypothetical protein n=1 Tax=Puia dinghuensis TaxID=1792502 RepID=UPI00166D1271|nr:hypothetical protein [Puia dinghuensis]